MKLVRLLLCFCLALAGPLPSPAADLPSKPAKPLAAAAPAPALPASTPASATQTRPAAASTPPAVEDPMERLRRRLNETLGAASASSQGRGTLRVVSKSTLAAAPSASGGRGRAVAKDSAAQRVRQAAAQAQDGGVDHQAPWGYGAVNGPSLWAQLKPEFELCGSGRRQSPIDIRDGIRVDLEPLRLDYQASPFSVLDTGWTVQANVAPGNWIQVMGRRYELQEIHFHRPSEERIDGRAFEMSAHLTHKDGDGRLAVVAVLLERGAANALVQSVWNNLPLERGEALAASGTLDPRQLLPEDGRYFTFMGSLTTPPCSEGVLWLVMKQPLHLSAAQVDIFARLHPMNARPVQATAGRLIKESN